MKQFIHQMNSSYKSAVLILGDQLFLDHPALKDSKEVIMIEADSICQKFQYHKHKLILILASMREYRDRLEKKGFKVWYVEYKPRSDFFEELERIVKKNHFDSIHLVPPESIRGLNSFEKFCTKNNLSKFYYDSPGFLTNKELGLRWLSDYEKPLMENFYRWQRKRLNILIHNGKPVGGIWNFDKQNRKPLEKKLIIPKIPSATKSQRVNEAITIVEKYFSNNPGEVSDFWLPTNREGALHWLHDFVENRLSYFGNYEDAMSREEVFLFHSVLSPLINIGLLTPEEIIDVVLKAYKLQKASINSVEGYLRQIVGWREYMRLIYWGKRNMHKLNYFGFSKKLESWWYDEKYPSQQLPEPIQISLKKVFKYGYNHHIERLMVFGNWFLLNEYNPQSVVDWFMSMYVDAYEWVMIPNVIGMSQYADGGYVATKPYISGDSYLQKMGNWWNKTSKIGQGEYTKKYWNFLIKHKDLLENNPRMSLVLSMAKKHKINNKTNV